MFWGFDNACCGFCDSGLPNLVGAFLIPIWCFRLVRVDDGSQHVFTNLSFLSLVLRSCHFDAFFKTYFQFLFPICGLRDAYIELRWVRVLVFYGF